MGLFAKLFKKNLTPEEQEKKSQEEKEWAEKCMRAGETFAEKIKYKEKIDSINNFANKYPRTFFLILTGLILGCFVLNWALSSTISLFENEQENVEVLQRKELPTLEEDAADKMIKVTFDSLMDRTSVLEKQLNVYLEQDSFSHQDSVNIKNILLEIRNIQLIVSGETTIE